MGLWLLSESLRTWDLDGSTTNLDRLLVAAADVPDWGPVVDADDPVFLPPGDMPARITQACLTSGQRAPEDRPSMVRCILDSLAAAYARTLADARRLTDQRIDTLHIVGRRRQQRLAVSPRGAGGRRAGGGRSGRGHGARQHPGPGPCSWSSRW